jgi:hypothetical protein
VWAPSAGATPDGAEPKSAAASSGVDPGPTPTREDVREVVSEGLLILVVLALHELRPPDDLAQPREELRLERADRQVATVGTRVHRVAGEPLRQHGRPRHQPVRAVRHRDDELRPLARALAREERRKDRRHRAERARREVGDLHGWQRRGRFRERPGPAEVVQIVSRALLVAPAGPEARDGTGHGARRHVLGSDP